MYSCKIDFDTGNVYLGDTVLDAWTDECFVKRIFPDFEHTHDFTGAATYAADIAMTIDDCHFNRMLIQFHKKRMELPPVIQDIYFFLDERPDWANNKLFRMTQAHTSGPDVRPGSTYRVTKPMVDILASDAFGGRQAHLRLRYNNATYSHNRTLNELMQKHATCRAGVVRLNDVPLVPGLKLGTQTRMRMMRQQHYLSSDFIDTPIEGQVEINTDKNGVITEILFRCHQFQSGSFRNNAAWLTLHYGSTDGDLVVQTAHGRAIFSPRAVGIKITFIPEGN